MKQSFKDTKVSGSLLSADISKSEEISRWRPIDKTLHYDFSGTNFFFKIDTIFFFIRRTHVLFSNGFKKKRNEALSKTTEAIYIS